MSALQTLLVNTAVYGCFTGNRFEAAGDMALPASVYPADTRL
jgi:hypothetical protein